MLLVLVKSTLGQSILIFSLKLLAIRNGPGAATIPQTRDPQTTLSKVTRIHLSYPLRDGASIAQGARRFWRLYLRSFKYHNPAIPITVEQKGSPRLTIFWSGQPPRKSRNGKEKKSTPTTDNALDELESIFYNPLLEARPQPPFTPSPSSALEDPSSSSPSQSSDASYSPLQQPTTSTTGSTHPSPSIRTSEHATSRAFHGRPAWEIWAWFRAHTGAKRVPTPQEDSKLGKELHAFQEGAQKDRVMVRAGVERMRAEEAQRRRAVEETARMRGEL